MKALTLLLDQLLSRTHHDWQFKLRAEWALIMGDLARRARLERINDTTIIIGVYDTHWMHELHALSRVLLERINGALSTVYPPGFMLKQVRCIWVQPKKVIFKKVVSEAYTLKKSTPGPEILQKVSQLPSCELQSYLIDYYIRCRKENNEP